MCLICVELKKNSLTSIEARQNLKEMRETIEEDHKLEVLRRIWDKEDEEYDSMLDYGSD
jgi:hypothetical protein